MINIQSYFIALLVLIQATLFISCDSNEHDGESNGIIGKEGVLAIVGSSIFTEDDLRLQLPSRLRGDDSITAVKSIVHTWVKNQLLYNYAQQENLVDEADLEKKIAEFKKELVIHQFETYFLVRF